MAKADKNKQVTKPPKKKIFSDMVIKETAFQKGMTYEEAKKHLEKNHQ